MSLLIAGATILDGISSHPIEGQSIWIEAGRIRALGRRSEIGISPSAEVIDARGKYVIPGLLDANVHLFVDLLMENLVRHLDRDRLEDVILEGAQVALRSGVTTVFDTWGPRRPLMAVRNRIAAGKARGSRIFCAGNIIGLDGPFSIEFDSGKTAVGASSALVERVNGLWVENVGPALSWMTPQQVAREVRTYLAKGIDFIKYASSEHRRDPSAFLAFSPRVQKAIVDEAHQAGTTAQAHTSSVEALWAAIDAGCDLIQHANITGPTAIPDDTLELMVARKTGAVVFPFTRRRLEWMSQTDDEFTQKVILPTVDVNCRRLIECGAELLMATDGHILAPEVLADPVMSKAWYVAGEDSLSELGEGHFAWLSAMEEKGCAPMRMLQAATRNVARAYGKHDLGTLAAGHIADVVILDKDPLQSAKHYRCIHTVIKDGQVVDRASLPEVPVLTRRIVDQPTAETLAYREHGRIGSGSRFPCC